MAVGTELSQAEALRVLVEISSRCRVTWYVRSGPPQLFERLDPTSARTFDRSWLHVPTQYLNLVLEQTQCVEPAMDRLLRGDPLSCEDYQLYPVVCCGQVAALMSTADNQSPVLTPNDESIVCSALLTLHHACRSSLREPASVFVSELFQRDNSAWQFLKRLGNLLTTEWHRSCAGLYTEFEGAYQLRLATGDVSRWSRLPRRLDAEVAARYLESMYRQEYFIPADCIPEYPTLLDAAPDFLCVHEGIVSERSKQLILMAGPGTLATVTVYRLLEYLRLLNQVGELQFVHGLELLDSYNKLAEEGSGTTSLDDLLVNTFTWLSQQLSVSRLVLHMFPRSSEDGHVRAVEQRQSHDPEIVVSYAPCLPDFILATIQQGRPFHVTDIQNAGLTDAEMKEHFLHGVLSELCLPLKAPEGVIGALLVGSPTSGDYLSDCEDLLQSVAAHISLWLQTSRRQTHTQWSERVPTTLAPGAQY